MGGERYPRELHKEEEEAEKSHDTKIKSLEAENEKMRKHLEEIEKSKKAI